MTLTHRVTGPADAPPLLLLNGGMMTISSWERIAADLEDRYRVVRCDFRGQVLSPGVPAPRIEAHVADLVALLDSLGIERIHAAGTSFGAFAALLLAIQHPDRVSSLTAMTVTEQVTPAMWEGTVRLREAALAAVAGGDGGIVFDQLIPATYSPAYLEANASALTLYRRQVAALPALWYEGLAAILAALEGIDFRPHLGQIRCPTLVLAAENDQIFPLQHSIALATAIPAARLEVVPGGSHGLVIERPEDVVGALRAFLGPLTA